MYNRDMSSLMLSLEIHIGVANTDRMNNYLSHFNSYDSMALESANEIMNLTVNMSSFVLV